MAADTPSEAAGFKDYFSEHADRYAQARPGYPPELIEFIAGHCRRRRLAWDAATGNGQAAVDLAAHFDRVHATDASADQIRAARPAAGVDYHCEPAEHCSLDDGEADLVSVAQAAHWFDHDAFNAEVRRVLPSGGVVAVWCYGLNRIDPAIDALVGRFYRDTLADYWPPERRHIESGYATLPFPWPTLATPDFEIRVQWTAPAYLDYVGSWSATNRCRADRGEDPVVALAAPLASAWGDGPRPVVWPIHLKLAVLD